MFTGSLKILIFYRTQNTVIAALFRTFEAVLPACGACSTDYAALRGAAVRIHDANSAATGEMLFMVTLRPRKETEQRPFWQNTEQNF